MDQVSKEFDEKKTAKAVRNVSNLTGRAVDENPAKEAPIANVGDGFTYQLEIGEISTFSR